MTSSRKAQGWVLTAVLVVIVGILATQPALAHGGVIEEQVYEVEFPVPAGEWSELNLEMERGGTIDWDVLTVDGEEIYLDLRGHGVRIDHHERFNSTSGESGVFTAPYFGHYSIFVENIQEDTVDVHLLVSGRFAVESELNIEAGGYSGVPGPGGPAAIAILAAGACFLAMRRRP